MKTHYLVTEEDFLMAREIERRLLSYGVKSGILFVGVSVDPATDKTPAIFNVWIGCHRDFEEKLMSSITQMVMRDEISRGLQIKVSAHRGVVLSQISTEERPLPS